MYFDQKGRLAATLKTPSITATQPGFLRVTDVHPTLGVFLDMGIAKELLLSIDDLPLQRELWPVVGDQIYCSLKIKGKLVAKITPKNEVTLKPKRPLDLKEKIIAYVQKIGKEGMNLLSKEGHDIFVHHTMYKKPHRLGQEIEVKVTYHSDKGYTGSLIDQKEVSMFQDANDILTYLIRHKEMPLSGESTPEEIDGMFKLSKKAFKRALGHLYKDRRIDFIDGKTILIKRGKDEQEKL
ncbi:MAG: hypothetical protein IH571_04790 [Acholeplasmataceae bacterium]|nr:hypothetical protein [Acholeplasmataceae bacterium]